MAPASLNSLTCPPEMYSALWSPDGQRLLFRVRNVGSFIIR
jgi:hypothetical protein